MAKRDYYEVLGVSKDADMATIKKAFKRLAIKFHPDHNKDPDAGEKFREINEAYQVLSDEQKRHAYDQYGFDGVNNQAGGFGGGFEQNFADIFGDAFADFFGGSKSRASSGPRIIPGQDLRIQLEITLEEAVKGVDKKINLKTYVPCEACAGTGSKSKSKPTACSHCHGTGQIAQRQGFFTVSQPCPHCRGTGYTITDPCPKCKGQGRVQSTKTLTIVVPPGIDDGDRIRLQGLGEAGLNGAPSGDLYAFIVVKPHEIFHRDGNNLSCEVPISFTTAALGGSVELPTLDGRVTVTIKPETQTGTVLRLAGKGVKSYNSTNKGNLYCKVVVETPVNLTKYQKDLLEKFEQSLNGIEPGASEDSVDDKVKLKKRSSHKPKTDGFLKGVKKFFDDLSK